MSFVEPKRDVLGTQRGATEVNIYEDVGEVNCGEEGRRKTPARERGRKEKEVKRVRTAGE